MLQVESHDNQTVLHCHGHLICGNEAEALQAALIRLLTVTDSVTIDLRHVRKMDCAGLGIIVRAMRDAAQNGKTVQLRSVPRHVRSLIELTGLQRILQEHSRVRLVGASAA